MTTLILSAAFQEPEYGGEGGGLVAALFGGAFGLFGLALAVVVIAGMWKVFEKTGRPGWSAIVPIYNLIVLLEIVGKPLWWIVLFFLPCVNFVAIVLVSIEVAKVFGKDVVYGIGLALLPFVFYPILGFGDARYQAPAAGAVRV
ncbi:MAG TPA: DUF5684 domain-containing protein [Vicinamibacteria bacterium]|nr:DUF5684 domain-containing protein [Vicinamibacteria bacterium]